MDNLQITRLGSSEIEHARKQVDLFWDRGPDEGGLMAFISDSDNILLSAELAGEPVGQVIGYLLPRCDGKNPMLFLYSIDVDETQQRQGIGRLLIEKFLRIGVENGCDEAFVFTNEANHPAMRLYESTRAVRPNDDDVLWEWEIQP